MFSFILQKMRQRDVDVIYYFGDIFKSLPRIQHFVNSSSQFFGKPVHQQLKHLFFTFRHLNTVQYSCFFSEDLPSSSPSLKQVDLKISHVMEVLTSTKIAVNFS